MASVELRAGGEHDALPFDAFNDLMRNVWKLVVEVGKTLNRETELEAVLTDLRMGSAVQVVELRSGPRSRGASPAQTLDAVVSGLELLQHRDEIPPAFSPRALTTCRHLGNAMRGGISSLDIATGTGQHQRTVRTTRALAVNARNANTGREDAFGGVYGVVDLLSTRRGKVFGIRDESNGHTIQCKCSPALLERVTGLLDKRTYVVGELTLNIWGQVIGIDAINVTELPDDRDLPSIASLGGAMRLPPGVSVDEYVRMSREDDVTADV